MSDDKMDDPAFPCVGAISADGRPFDAPGMTKLEWASIQIAAGLLVDGATHASEESRKQIATDAVALACEVLRQAAP